jgi:conjugal transfer/entry exclusion protein
MKEQDAIDRILESENLTDALQDHDANWLLEWGTARVPELLNCSPDDREAGKKVNALMGVMRKVNQITGERGEKDSSQMARDISQLAKYYQQAFGQSRPVRSRQAAQIADQIAAQPAQQAMQTLLDWLRPAEEQAAGGRDENNPGAAR